MSGPSYLWGRFTNVHPDISFSTHIAHFIRDNHMRTLNFQVCASGTLDDNTAGAWSVYPVAKVCLVVPWWYALFFSIVVFFLADFVMMFALAFANVAYGFLMGLF